MSGEKTIQELIRAHRQGLISRRDFVQRCVALGVAAPLAAMLASSGSSLASSTRSGFSGPSLAQQGVELTIGQVEEPDTLDPHNLTAAAAGLVGYIVMPGLVWWDYDLGVSPMIAESWETSEDGLTWTFKLRPNLVFHNGKPCTAEEVVRNFEHIIDPEGGSFLAPDYASVASVEAPDETTVVFTLSEPFAPFLAILTNRCAITDMDAYDETTPIGTGPFKIVEWNRGTGMVLEAHDQYWEEGLPLASKVNWNFYPNSDSRVLALQAGDIDIVYSVPAEQVDLLMQEDSVHVDPIPGVTHDYIAFNCATGPFSDVRMRKAVAHAIDKELVVEGAEWGFADATNIPFPPTSPWYIEIPDYEYDPEKAKALMAEAGFADGLDIDMPVAATTPLPEIAELIQPDLAAIGINVRLVETEWASYWPETYLKGQFDITPMGYSARVDPDQTFYPRYRTGGVHNPMGYSNARMDELLDSGRLITDQAERKKIYDEVQTILVDELPWLWLYLPNVRMGWRQNISGFRQHPAAHFYMTESTKEG